MPRRLMLAGLALALALPATAAAQDGRCLALDWTCAGHPGGTEQRPLQRPGTVGVLAGFRRDELDEDVCAQVARRHDRYTPPYDGGAFGRYYAVWVDLGGKRPDTAFLACGEREEVWGHTSGPGEEGVSLRCPGESHPVDRGAAWTVTASRGFAQVWGGFGSGDDGYWDYRFHNPERGTVDARLYGICVPDRGAIWG